MSTLHYSMLQEIGRQRYISPTLLYRFIDWFSISSLSNYIKTQVKRVNTNIRQKYVRLAIAKLRNLVLSSVNYGRNESGDWPLVNHQMNVDCLINLLSLKWNVNRSRLWTIARINCSELTIISLSRILNWCRVVDLVLQITLRSMLNREYAIIEIYNCFS